MRRAVCRRASSCVAALVLLAGPALSFETGCTIEVHGETRNSHVRCDHPQLGLPIETVDVRNRALSVSVGWSMPFGG